MLDHVKLGVSDHAASKAFFLEALEPPGVTAVTEWPPSGVGAPGLRPNYHAAFVIGPDGHHIEAVCHEPEA